MFPDGSTAMMPMGTWFAATMIDKINKGEGSVNWGIATLPHPEGVEAGYVAGSTTPIAINAASANQELAWEFVKFACGPTARSSWPIWAVCPLCWMTPPSRW